jgi:GxxExxY protein
MGSGFLEAVYQECLEKELTKSQIPFISQGTLNLHYKNELLIQTYKPDFICFNKIIVELKAIKNIQPEHEAQVFNYLRASRLKLGLIANFGHFPKVEIKRIVL